MSSCSVFFNLSNAMHSIGQSIKSPERPSVRVNSCLSDPFTTTSGVRQGCVLAPALFCIAIDWIMSRCAGSMGTAVGSTTFTGQDYADDAVLFTDDPSKWTEILAGFIEACQNLCPFAWVIAGPLSGRLHRSLPDNGPAHVMAEDSSPKCWIRNPTMCCNHPGTYGRRHRPFHIPG